MLKTEHAFVWAFVIGFILILAFKFISRGFPVPGGIIAAVSGIVIMGIYRSTQKRTRPVNEHPHLGDEIYYLGLLYTLTSLCAALLTLFLLDEWGSWSVGEQQLSLEQRTDEMIGSFGIALLTTMFGIVMRMTLQRRGREGQAMTIRIPYSAEHDEAKSTLDEGYGGRGAINLEQYAYELRRQLQNATNAFSTHTNQSILQAKTVHNHMDEMMRTFHEGLEEKVRSELEAVKTIYADMATNAERVMEQTETQQVALQRVLEKFEAQVSSMDNSIERIRVGSNETAENLGAVAAQSQASTQVFAEGGKAMTERLDEIAAAGKRLEEALDTTVIKLKARADVMQEQLDAQNELKSNHEAMKTIYADMAANAELVTERTEIQQGTVQRALEKFELQVNSMDNSIERIRVGSDQAAENLGAIAVQSQASTQAFAQGGKAVTERLAEVAAAGKRQEEALDATALKLKMLADITGEEVDAQNQLKSSIAKIQEVAETIDSYAQSLKNSEQEIQQINVGLNSVHSALGDEGLRLSQAISDAIAALDQARHDDQNTRNLLDRFWRRS